MGHRQLVHFRLMASWTSPRLHLVKRPHPALREGGPLGPVLMGFGAAEMAARVSCRKGVYPRDPPRPVNLAPLT